MLAAPPSLLFLHQLLSTIIKQQLSGKPVSFALYVCRVNVHCLENYLSGSEYSFYENVTIRLYNDFTLSYKFI